MLTYDRQDVVLVVEKSVSMRRYLPELLEAYVAPTIALFGGGLSEESDVFFTQSSVVQYASVFYGTELSLMGSWGQVQCYGPTCSEADILSSVKNARYTCKNLSRQAFILDGLQAAVNLFDTMKKHYSSSENVQRCCILITQSTPMSNPWSPTNPEKVLLEIKRTNIQLSVISAHKLVELYRLFDAAGGDHQASLNKNYASKPQHLVLLNGFTLQERALSPSLVGYPPVTNVATPPAVLAAQVPPQGVTVAPVAGPGPSPNPLGPGAAIPSPVPVSVGSPAPPQAAQVQVGMVRPGSVTQIVVNPTPNNQPINIPNLQPNVVPVRGPMPGIPRMINQPRQRWPGDTSAAGTNTVPGVGSWQGQRPPVMQPIMVNQQSQQAVQTDTTATKQLPNSIPNVEGNMLGVNQAGAIGGQGQPQAAMQQAGAVGQGMNPPNQRSVVWQGTLEWQEKKTDNNSRVVHQVTCKMTSLVVNGEPEVKADCWAPTLIMQMIPKHILGSIGNSFFKNVKTVMFLPDQSPALDILTNFLFRGMAGCVHVSHASPAQSEVKVIILLFSSEKKAYVGFIPVDQYSFVNKIKSVIQSARKGQLVNSMMAQGSGPNVSGNNTAHMVVPGGSGMQQLPSNPNSGLNVIPTQSMIIQQNPQLNQALSQGSNTILGGGQLSQMTSGTVSQAMGQQGPGGPVSVQMGTGPSVLPTQLATRPTLNMQQQQQQQQQSDLIQMRQNQQQQQQHQTAIRQQLHQQLQQRPGMAMNIGQQGPGSNTALGQPRIMQPSMPTPGLKQLLQQQHQQVRLQQQQVQQQQQQHILLMQQQGIRPQMAGQGQQVMGQAIGQQSIGQQAMGQQSMTQQGIGQPIQDNNDYMVDLL